MNSPGLKIFCDYALTCSNFSQCLLNLKTNFPDPHILIPAVLGSSFPLNHSIQNNPIVHCRVIIELLFFHQTGPEKDRRRWFRRDLRRPGSDHAGTGRPEGGIRAPAEASPEDGGGRPEEAAG